MRARSSRLEFALILALACIGAGCSRGEGTGQTASTTNGVSALKPAPSVMFETLDGRPMSLAEYRGKVVLLNFWGTWCGVCRSDIPELIKLQKEYGNRGFTVLGIAMEDKQ